MRRAALIAALLIAACARHEPTPCEELDAGRPVDATLLAFLSRARAAHHAADRAEERADLARAARALEAVVTGPLPPGSAAEAPEVREVLADTLARLAELKSRRGEFDAALADLARGLELAREPTYFRGHLYEVEGLVWERKAAVLRAGGAEGPAREANAKALEALETSMKIQAEVIRQAVPPPGR
jgi:tetratricopeptide (TPR) repeat protein